MAPTVPVNSVSAASKATALALRLAKSLYSASAKFVPCSVATSAATALVRSSIDLFRSAVASLKAFFCAVSLLSTLSLSVFSAALKATALVLRLAKSLYSAFAKFAPCSAATSSVTTLVRSALSLVILPSKTVSAEDTVLAKVLIASLAALTVL